MRTIVGLGAGGLCKVLVDLIRQSGDLEIVGLTDSRPELHGRRLHGVPILGGDDILPRLRCTGVDAAFVGVGAVGDVALRKSLFERADAAGFEMVSVVHPGAHVAPTARIGRAVIVLAGAVVSSDVVLGDNVVVYSGAVVEHDSVVEDHVHISPGVAIAGGVHIGAETFVGIGASIVQGVTIGHRAVVGAGAVVIRDVPDQSTVVGVPARVLAGTRQEA